MWWLREATIGLLICSSVLSLPQQIVFNPVHTTTSLGSRILQGDEMMPLFESLANGLNKGFPPNWERLVNQPQTVGTSAIEYLKTDDLYGVMGNWGLDPEVRDQAFRDVDILVRIPADESRYLAHAFDYNNPNCPGAMPFCMTTLLVVIRRMQDENQNLMTEIGHIYIKSFAEGIQQMEQHHKCHSCRLISRCCHDPWEPRPYFGNEIEEIRTVLSTKQAFWAYDNMHASLMESRQIYPTLPVDTLLERFVNNKQENRDVFDSYSSLLGAVQNAMKSRQQTTKNMKMTVKTGDVVIILSNLMSKCFEGTSHNETAYEWWHRVHDQNQEKVISLECGHIGQSSKPIIPPEEGCRSSTSIKAKTDYSWITISPRGDLADCLLITNSVDTTHLECDPIPELPDLPDEYRGVNQEKHNCGFTSENGDILDGSIIRWSTVSQDGSFPSQTYLELWSKYNIQTNKAMMDILRYSSATSYLKIPYGRDTPLIGTQGLDSLTSLGSSMSAFAKGWSDVANAFKTTITETSQLKICLGFEKYAHKTRTIAADGIEHSDLPKVVDALIQLAKVPEDDDLRTFMLLVNISSNLTWSGQTVSYTSSEGYHRFFYFYKYVNDITNKIDIVFGMLNGDFNIAPDLLVIHRKKSYVGGIYETDDTIYKNVPHVITLNDTVLLGMYFEIIAYRDLAMVQKLPVPDFPNLNFLCNR